MRIPGAPFIAVLATALSACAFIPNEVQLEVQLVPDLGSANGAGSTVYLALLDDVRSDKTKVGVVRNGFNMETAAVSTADNPSVWVSNSLKANLERAGYKVETVDGRFLPSSDQFLLSGRLSRAFSDPQAGLVSVTVRGDVEATMKADYGGRTTQVPIGGHHEQLSLVGTGGELHKGVLNAALQDFVRKVVAWVAELRGGAKPRS
ncbi:MAG: hypothetical protein H7841_13615 [Magnetospirillum sp. WYHS-4]